MRKMLSIVFYLKVHIVQKAPPQDKRREINFPSSIRQLFPSTEKWTLTPFSVIMSIPLSTIVFMSNSSRGINCFSISVVSLPGM